LKDKRIYIVRHGQTDKNLNKILQGSRVDEGLNDTGLKQAELFYEKYRMVSFKNIYTSTLIRSVQSVEKFIGDGIPFEQCKELDEISYGEMDGFGGSGSNDSIYQNLIQEWNRENFHAKITQGESPFEVQERLLKFLKIILSRPEEDIILICMHGRSMRILLSTMMHNNLNYMHQYNHQNMCVYIINYEEGRFCVEESNNIDHLNFI
jgi:broad specificity phosphatase PhoE